MKKHQFVLISLLYLVISLFSFQNNNVNQATKDELKKRLDKFKKIKQEQCRKKNMEEALIIVDSMLVERAQIIKTSPINKPPIPPKPSAPTVTLPDADTPIEPIIKN